MNLLWIEASADLIRWIKMRVPWSQIYGCHSAWIDLRPSNVSVFWWARFEGHIQCRRCTQTVSNITVQYESSTHRTEVMHHINLAELTVPLSETVNSFNPRITKGVGGYHPLVFFQRRFFLCGFFGNASVYLWAIQFHIFWCTISKKMWLLANLYTKKWSA